MGAGEPAEVAYLQAPGVTLDGVPSNPVLRLPTGERVGLSSEVAVLVFELCKEPTTAEALARRVVEIYDVGLDQARRDIHAFVETLASAGALRRVRARGPEPEDSGEPGGDGGSEA